MSIPSFMLPTVPLAGRSSGPGFLSKAAGPPPVGGGRARSLNRFVMQMQLHDNWCWAAVTASIAQFYRAQSWTVQCVVAAAEKNTQCCDPVNVTACDRPAPLDTPLGRTGHFSQRVDSSEEFSTVVAEIDAQRAFACRIEWHQSSDAHFVAVAGYSVDDSGTEYLEIGDPLIPGTVHTTYAEFSSNYRQAGAWANSYFTLSSPLPAGGAPAGDALAPVAP